MNIVKWGRFFKIPNKFWELQLAKWPHVDFKISLRYSSKCDHAGLHFEIYFWKINFTFQIYDSRHWDYENKCWEVPRDKE